MDNDSASQLVLKHSTYCWDPFLKCGNCNSRRKQHQASTYLFFTMSTQALKPIVGPNPDEAVDDFDKNSPPLLPQSNKPMHLQTSSANSHPELEQ